MRLRLRLHRAKGAFASRRRCVCTSGTLICEALGGPVGRGKIGGGGGYPTRKVGMGIRRPAYRLWRGADQQVVGWGAIRMV
jgi:hypothetical protein